MGKVVWKYGTGQEIPDDAKYLCTQVETTTHIQEIGKGYSETTHRKVNSLVWHYYERPAPSTSRTGEKEGNGGQ